MSVRRITKVGNSLGVTLPPEHLEALGLSVGDKVEVLVDCAARRVIVQSAEPSGVSPAFVSEARAFAERHRETLHALAKR